MMRGAEGWDGQSLRAHIEDAATAAGDAMQAIAELQERVDDLEAQLEALAERGGVGSSEVAEAKRRIAETLQLHGSSRFQRWAKSSSDRMVITNRMGFVKIEGDPDIGETESTYFFMVEPLKEILAGLDFRSVVTELQAEGVIVDHGGKPNKVFHVSSGGGKHLLYQINRDILDTLSTCPAPAPHGATSQEVGQ
ncbi:hypothetical protein SAMN06265173_101195 [Thalassovita litoralis]|uniref:Uncharacterized protein n=1 Tax=Thalassovita litoralis TaxID=1010611 RepID=A0A521AJ31_9RHOB|nr:hypothetical protein [Thalassovita litoralis]SMO34855.1 hypothetical protein SAMN06265173_101195 [Thalassovita litoralis]